MAEFCDAALDGRLQEEGGCAADAPVMSSERTPEEEFLASVLAGRDLSDLVDPVEAEAAEQERIAAMTPEERAAHFERCALETVFDDIRLRARSGELTTPDYWESVGLVPDHMEPSAFTALVFDTIIDAQARSEDRAAAEQAFSARRLPPLPKTMRPPSPPRAAQPPGQTPRRRSSSRRLRTPRRSCPHGSSTTSRCSKARRCICIRRPR